MANNGLRLSANTSELLAYQRKPSASSSQPLPTSIAGTFTTHGVRAVTKSCCNPEANGMTTRSNSPTQPLFA
jgi:hypothetical protein